MGYIYKVYNDINDKVYIGKTLLTPEVRFKEHLDDANRRNKEHRPLYAAIRKYRKEHFYVDTLEECNDSVLAERERFWIQKLDSLRSGYNATFGGDGKQRFDHDMILKELLLCPYPKRVAEQIGCCPELVRNIAKRYGIKVRPESEMVMKEQKSKSVTCENDDLFLVFDSVADAARWLKDTGVIKSLKSGVRSHISDCARGKRMSAYGYKWSYN